MLLFSLLFSCSIVYDSFAMYYSTPGFSVFHYLQEFAKTHVHSGTDTVTW